VFLHSASLFRRERERERERKDEEVNKWKVGEGGGNVKKLEGERGRRGSRGKGKNRKWGRKTV
jgi:hypothetical protein